MTFRMADCQQAYSQLRGRGVRFLTPPVDSGPEVRCFFRDPDGHPLELSQAK
jgi:catechol 2,3-dioxygenase-like lactoylglutathione lyase family enzyme